MKKAVPWVSAKKLVHLCLIVCVLAVLTANSKEFLLILVNEEEVATLHIVASGNSAPNQVFHFSEQLSSACSQHNHTGRCRNITLHQRSNGNQTSYLVIAPLQTKIGIKELQYNGMMFEVVRSSEMELPVGNCILLDIINISDQVIAPCITSNVLYSCSVQLYSSSEVNCRDILTLSRDYSDADYPFITNFVRSSDHEEYLVAIRGQVYGINFGHSTFLSRGNLQNSNCERLEYIGNLFAYCGSRQAVNLSDEHAVSYSLSSGTGIPFVCPMSGQNVTVREMQGTISLRYNSLDHPLNTTSFVYGECYNNLFFLVNDPSGVTVFDITSASPQPPVLPDSSHTTSLVLLEGPYVVAMKQNSVVLYDPSLQPVVRWRGVGAAMVGVLSGFTEEAAPPTDPEGTTPPTLSDTTHTPSRFTELHIKIGVGLGIGVPLFLIIIIMAAIITILIMIQRNRAASATIKDRTLSREESTSTCVPLGATTSAPSMLVAENLQVPNATGQPHQVPPQTHTNKF